MHGRPTPTWRSVALAVVVMLLALPAAVQAQTATDARLRQQRADLDRLRNERGALEKRMSDLRGSVTTLAEEVRVIDRQAVATARLVKALDDQLQMITTDVDSATRHVERSEHELVVKRATLRRRVRDIYKRGPTYHVQALLSAQSFGELIARYKYLHELARHDRALVQRVEKLRNDVASQRDLLVRLQLQIETSRLDKQAEEERLRSLEQQQKASLADARRATARTETRLEQLRRDEARMSRVIGDAIEADRRRVAAAPATRGAAPRAPSSIRTSDLGRLDWPVEGTFVYDFGRERKANNTAVRWNGVGIAAAQGTPVRAVAGGTVLEVARFGTYGQTVIVEHGGGDYSVYGSLASTSVTKGSSIAKGQAIGTVGMSDPDMGPHLHFEIRKGGPAVDPKQWLRAQR
ncbi:MAG: peptidoglycan DD-metalloendopeptidase family protein [Gemmatimonadaceae bacterium]|nr:peptidoglycan DD-metalloendopeptidase family protein [Gemmatimonadaceae bacterium]